MLFLYNFELHVIVKGMLKRKSIENKKITQIKKAKLQFTVVRRVDSEPSHIARNSV